MKRISGWGRRQVRRAQVIPGGGVRSHFPGSKMTRSPTDVRSSCIFTGRRNRCAHSVAFSPFPSLSLLLPASLTPPCPPLFLTSQLTQCLETGNLGKYRPPPTSPSPGLCFRIQKREVAVSGAKGPVSGSRAGGETKRWWRTWLEGSFLWD